MDKTVVNRIHIHIARKAVDGDSGDDGVLCERDRVTVGKLNEEVGRAWLV